MPLTSQLKNLTSQVVTPRLQFLLLVLRHLFCIHFVYCAEMGTVAAMLLFTQCLLYLVFCQKHVSSSLVEANIVATDRSCSCVYILAGLSVFVSYNLLRPKAECAALCR